MNHKDILNRAWHILWNYKALWVFGFILAITTAPGNSSNTASNASNSSQSSQQPPLLGESFEEGWADATREFEQFIADMIPAEIMTASVLIAVLVSCVIVILIVVTVTFRYMSETALIQMVDRYEETGNKISIREGFRLGFSRTAWKVFLVDLAINLPLIMLGIFFVIIVAIPSFLLMTDSEVLGIFGVVVSIGLFFVGIFLAIIIFALISLLKHFFRRAVAIAGLSVFEAIRYGFQLVNKNLINIGLMWLITIGINIGFAILLIPAALAVLIISAVSAGLIGLSVGGLTALIIQGALPIAIGIMTGLPIFIIMIVIPLGFLDGLRETYMSSIWTLTYREARALETLSLTFDTDESFPELEEPISI